MRSFSSAVKRRRVERTFGSFSELERLVDIPWSLLRPTHSKLPGAKWSHAKLNRRGSSSRHIAFYTHQIFCWRIASQIFAYGEGIDNHGLPSRFLDLFDRGAACRIVPIADIRIIFASISVWDKHLVPVNPRESSCLSYCSDLGCSNDIGGRAGNC